MIIFDLDGTLANCEHRRHFVDPSKHPDFELRKSPTLDECVNNRYIPKEYILKGSSHKDCVDGNFIKFKPDWKSFYEACDKDDPIIPTLNILTELSRMGICPITKNRIREIQIWSGRCESVKGKTYHWLMNQGLIEGNEYSLLKMRPIGDNTPDDQLKERWLKEFIENWELTEKEKQHGMTYLERKIEMVFDDRPKVIRMWRRRGIFVFNCCQHDEEFLDELNS